MASIPSASGGDDVVQGVMNVTKEDQQKINQFARLNARLEDIREEMSSKENELDNYEDALSEAETKDLEGEADNLHLLVGDIMVNIPEMTVDWLKDGLATLIISFAELGKKKAEILNQMSELKAHLYARFGNNIHLEVG